MAYVLGKDVILKVGDGAGSEVFTALGGEGELSWSRSSDEIDLTTKDDDTYKNSSYGLQSISIGVSGKVKLPDTALERVDTVAKSGTPNVNVQIYRRDTSVVIFAGAVAVGNFSCEFPSGGAATYSFAMKNVGAPTTDDIGA